nr:MAG TPA: hypothetical protein [Caudoviricetes sp.]
METWVFFISLHSKCLLFRFPSFPLNLLTKTLNVAI